MKISVLYKKDRHPKKKKAATTKWFCISTVFDTVFQWETQFS
jgi:hypothetical protein